MFSLSVRTVKTAHQFMQDTAARASSNTWAEELHMLLHDGFFHVSHLYPECFCPLETALDMHFRCLMKLLEKRVQSLSSYYLKPPLRWAGALQPATRHQTLQKMATEPWPIRQ